MKFVAAVTISPADLRRVVEMWDSVEGGEAMFSHVLLSPLFASPGTVELVKALKRRRHSEIYFDSGGYYVQQGRLSYERLYTRLFRFYVGNQWADWYVLPDHVPTSLDDATTVEYKVRDTATVSSLFYQELPPSIRQRAIPVVQGHTRNQIEYCVETYVKMGARYIGFGSFGTAGANSSINQLTTQSLHNLEWTCALAAHYDLKLHLFGMTTPPLVWLFGQLGADSFDSLGWNKTANYGNVYLPFIKAYNVSYRDPDQASLLAEQFQALKVETAHHCAFCEDFALLSREYHYRRAHNLAVLNETAERCRTEAAAQCVQRYAPSYLRRLIRRTTCFDLPLSMLG